MQEVRKKHIKNIFDNIRTKLTNKKLIIIIIAIGIFASCVIRITIPKVAETLSKALQSEFFEYEVVNNLGNGKFEILIKVKNEDGIEYIKYPNGDILYPNGKKIVAIDYKIIEEVAYDFIVKANGKDEITQTIYKEAAKIQGDYQLVNGVYLNKPDLSGFDAKYTRYLQKSTSQDIMEPSYWISDEADSNWYSYKDGNWANIYIEDNGSEVYYVWIPRYCFKLDDNTQRTDVKFIDTSNNYIDAEGNKIDWIQLNEQGYQVPEAFEFNGIRIPGYWTMKYTSGDITTPSTINYDMSVLRGIITIKNITLNTSITNSNPITKYTIALNGEIIKTIEDEISVSSISSQIIEFSNMIEGDNVVNITGLNANGEIVGSMTKLYSPAKVNEPDLSGFNQETTFYVTYDKNENEHSIVPINQVKPEDWYDYGDSKWANIVTRNNGLEVYYTWIPRYEFKLDQTGQRSNVNFIEGTKIETTPGYQIPEAFTFDGQELTGYWAMKYTTATEASPRFDTELVVTSNSIKAKGIIGTAKADGQVYKYYINGQYKGEKTTASDIFEYSGLDSNTKYTILVEIRDSSTDKYIGTIVKQISTIDANKPDLTGFNEANTYYVLYDDTGKETIGDKIKNDGSNMPPDWYNYSERRWANIVTRNNGLEIYYTWIPRYEFMITSSQYAQPASGRTEVRFIQGTSTETTPGYQIPEAFTFNGQQITGYWAMKYTAGE